MYYSMQILFKNLLDTCYFLCRIKTEVTTWLDNDDNVIVQTSDGSNNRNRACLFDNRNRGYFFQLPRIF